MRSTVREFLRAGLVPSFRPPGPKRFRRSACFGQRRFKATEHTRRTTKNVPSRRTMRINIDSFLLLPRDASLWYRGFCITLRDERSPKWLQPQARWVQNLMIRPSSFCGKSSEHPQVPPSPSSRPVR